MLHVIHPTKHPENTSVKDLHMFHTDLHTFYVNLDPGFFALRIQLQIQITFYKMCKKLHLRETS